MSRDYEASIIRMFGRLVERGYIYRGLRPVMWCTVCSTALAEAEVEYAGHGGGSIYVRFPLTLSGDEAAALARNSADAAALRAGAGKLSAVIWTTTPRTLTD